MSKLTFDKYRPYNLRPYPLVGHDLVAVYFKDEYVPKLTDSCGGNAANQVDFMNDAYERGYRTAELANGKTS